MKKPTPEEFSLSASDIARLNASLARFDDRVGWAAVVIPFCGAAVGFARGMEQGWVAAIVLALVATMFTFFLVAVPVLIGLSYIPRLSSRIRNYFRFKSALQAFEEWETRTRTEFWRSLSCRAFEVELARLLEAHGYSVELTPYSGDMGVDIVLRRGGRTTLVQCKQTAKPVGPAVARELYGSLVSSEADDAILACTAGVSRGARDFLSGKQVRVMDLLEILELQKQAEV